MNDTISPKKRVQIGSLLREKARKLGMSDNQVARELGIGERRYAHYVSDRNQPNLDVLLDICRVLQTSPNELLGLSSPTTPFAFSKQTLQKIIEAVENEAFRLKITLTAENKSKAVSHIYEYLTIDGKDNLSSESISKETASILRFIKNNQ